MVPVNQSMPARPACAARSRKRRGTEAGSLPVVGHHDRRLRRSGTGREANELGEGDDLGGGLVLVYRDERESFAAVGSGEVAEAFGGERGDGRQEAAPAGQG